MTFNDSASIRRTPPADAAHLRWCDALVQIGSEMEASVQRVLDCLRMAAVDGKVDMKRAVEIRNALEQALAVGTTAWQIGRLTEDTRRACAQPLCLAQCVRGMLNARSKEFHKRQLSVSQFLPASWVLIDPHLSNLLVHALASWALQQSLPGSTVDVRIHRGTREAPVELVCRFTHRPGAGSHSRFGGHASFGAAWQLLCHLAHAAQADMRSGEDGGESWLRLGFASACKEAESLPGMEAVELPFPMSAGPWNEQFDVPGMPARS